MKLDNRFSGLDAKALQSGLQRFWEFFGGGGAGEQEDTLVLVHWLVKKITRLFYNFFLSKIIISIGGEGGGQKKVLYKGMEHINGGPKGSPSPL